jgi:hypothetical protein
MGDRAGSHHSEIIREISKKFKGKKKIKKQNKFKENKKIQIFFSSKIHF